MKSNQITMPEIGLLAASRAMFGLGLGLLLADKLPREKRNALGWTLFAIGAVSTVPLARDLLGKMNESVEEPVMYRPPLDLVAEER